MVPELRKLEFRAAVHKNQTVGVSPPHPPAARACSTSILHPHGRTTRSHHGAGAYRQPPHPCARKASELQFRIYTDIGIFTGVDAAMI